MSHNKLRKFSNRVTHTRYVILRCCRRCHRADVNRRRGDTVGNLKIRLDPTSFGLLSVDTCSHGDLTSRDLFPYFNWFSRGTKCWPVFADDVTRAQSTVVLQVNYRNSRAMYIISPGLCKRYPCLLDRVNILFVKLLFCTSSAFDCG